MDDDAPDDDANLLRKQCCVSGLALESAELFAQSVLN
jgi:hypothetical protein